MKIKKFNELYKINENFKPSRIYKKETFKNYDILIGRSADMNDVLTFDVAEDDDLWLHASGVPGSHIVIKYKGEDIPFDVIQYAAILAVKNSKGKNNELVKVIYTKRKNVKKDTHHKTGQVSVDYDKSKFITVKI